MEIKQESNRFYIESGNIFVGEISFSSVDKNVISIDHTFVNDEYRGQGIAGQLLDALLKYANENDLKIVPVCEYAKAVFKFKPEIRHLLTQNYQNILKEETK
jgi:Predicted acetyltransferase